MSKYCYRLSQLSRRKHEDLAADPEVWWERIVERTTKRKDCSDGTELNVLFGLRLLCNWFWRWLCVVLIITVLHAMVVCLLQYGYLRWVRFLTTSVTPLMSNIICTSLQVPLSVSQLSAMSPTHPHPAVSHPSVPSFYHIPPCSVQPGF